MKTQWLLVFEYIPWAGQEKVEEEMVYGTEASARTYYQSFKGDPRFRRVSLVREVTDRQIMASYGAPDRIEVQVHPHLTPDPED